ncbi:hypothetical protein H4R18_005761 [Coemansia javaensis]|uniref:Uncharacterized protein n=1 Tax=Coemansia javaensis TaxID=2761396 RepID=A0A9W8H0M4_9FUNG|nr:hypothetical protein H4R18_005761 [Coemansia javaensis]
MGSYNYDGGYPPQTYDDGYGPFSGNGDDDGTRALRPQQGGGPSNRPPPPPNPAVGSGPMSSVMPSAPAGFEFGGGYPPPGGGFGGPGGFAIPPPNGGYGGGYGGGGYPPMGGSYPQQYGARPPMGGGYPPMSNGGGYPPMNGGGYPPASGGGYPPMSAGGYPPANRPPPSSAGPASNPSLRPPPQQQQNLTQSAPNMGNAGNKGAPPTGSGGAQPSMYRPQGSASQGPVGGGGSANRGMYWSAAGTQNARIPGTAVRAGSYLGDPVFIGRAKHKDSLVVGMATMAKEGLAAAYDGKPLLFREYEVLCGPADAYRWVEVDGRFHIKDLKGARPLQCGTDKHGEPLYAARTELHGRDYVGVVNEKTKVMRFPHKGSEDKAKTYSVLCET